MRLQFLGSGSAFTLDNYQSNMIIEVDKNVNGHIATERLLIDCGSDARFAFRDLGLKISDLDAVYISHLHADHMGGLEWLAFSSYFGKYVRPKLFLSQYLESPLWNALSPGLRSLQGEIANLRTYFDVKTVKQNGVFIWEGIRFRLIQTIHVVNGFHFMPSFGLMFTVNGKKIYITTDTQFAPNQLRDFYAMSDVIFHDCETSKFFTGVHAHFKELQTLPSEVKEKMWLYHYNMGELPDINADGFQGFVQKGQVFTF